MRSILAIIFLAALQFANAQKLAVTQEGEEVILYDDGTWKHKENNKGWETTLDTIVCTKPANASFLVKGKKVKYGVWLNPKKWKFKATESTTKETPAEYTFSLIGEDAYAMIIPEAIQVPIDQLKSIAFKNASNAAPDCKIEREEVRVVNGKTLACLQMSGTIKGIKFMYFGYYYSSEKGSIQFLAYTSQNLFPKYKADLEQLLNGLVEM